MRVLICILLVIPFFSTAQINRSTIQLAHENIDEYLTSKLFRNKLYRSVSYGALKERKDKDKETVWEMDHVFFIEEKSSTTNNTDSTKQEYNFTIYFDRRMNVTKAESIQR
jgi:hypothetical protein